MFTTLTNQHMHEQLPRITYSCYCKVSRTSNMFTVQAKKTANSNAEFFVSVVSNICKQLTVAKSSLSQHQFRFTGQARSFSPRQFLSDKILRNFVDRTKKMTPLSFLG